MQLAFKVNYISLEIEAGSIEIFLNDLLDPEAKPVPLLL